RAARGVRPLRGEDAEEVAVERLRLGARVVQRISFPRRVGEEGSERTLAGSARVLPVEAVALARLAAALLREDGAGIVPGVLQLRLDVRTKGRDRRQLVAADAPVEQLVLA